VKKPARTERRWPAKPSAVRQSFRELSKLTGRRSPEFLTKTVARKTR
jgi:hypothetical protein